MPPGSCPDGTGGFPYTLSYQRTHRANLYKNGISVPWSGSIPVVAGWTDNIHRSVSVGSSGMATLGDGPVPPSVSALVAFYVSQQIYATQPGTPAALLARWVTEPFVSHWWTVQVLHNTVTLLADGSSEQFVRMPIANPDCQLFSEIDSAQTTPTSTCTPSSWTFNPPRSYAGSGGSNWVLRQTNQPYQWTDLNGQPRGQWGIKGVRHD